MAPKCGSTTTSGLGPFASLSGFRVGFCCNAFVNGVSDFGSRILKIANFFPAESAFLTFSGISKLFRGF
jgi:hypothetical protein